MLVRMLGVTAFLLCASGCSTIESNNYIAQPIGRPLQAGIGGVIAHVDRKRNLENLFGKADIYGRKTYEGFSELRFMGVQDGQAAIRRIDVAVQNDETTMSRTGIYIPSQSTSQTSGYIGSTPFNATTTRQGPGVYIPPRPSNGSVSAPNIIDFLVPIGQPMPFEGYTVTIAQADRLRVSYSIQKATDATQ